MSGASRCRPGMRQSRQSSKHIAGPLANSVLTGPPGLLAARNRGYRFKQGNLMGWTYEKCQLKLLLYYGTWFRPQTYHAQPPLVRLD